MNTEALADNALSSKNRNKQAIGSHKTSRKLNSSKREKGKEKMDEMDAQESSKRIKK